MDSFASLIGAIGAPHLVASLGLPYQTVAGWKRRNSIPTDYWPDVIRAAGSAGIDLSETDLLRLRPKRKLPSRDDEQKAA